MLTPEYDKNGLPVTSSLTSLFGKVNSLIKSGAAISCYTPTLGGAAEAILKMSLGNGLGFEFADVSMDILFSYSYGSFILETDGDIDGGTLLGTVTENAAFTYDGQTVALSELQTIYENKLESVYPCNINQEVRKIEKAKCTGSVAKAPAVKSAQPTVVIPVFPGTNCEYDSAKAFADAGAKPIITVINNLSADGIARSAEQFAKAVSEAQIVFLPGGFSGGDEPDGSGKFITAFLRNAQIKEEISRLLDDRGGLMAGICNGFQALIKLGLVPYGKIIDTDADCPTLTFNTIGRHQSKIVRTRIASNMSPWLKHTSVGDIFCVPISHGEGRFYASDSMIENLSASGQIATQYVDLSGEPTSDIRFNPNDSAFAIEGISSPDGRVFGKMGHSERIGSGLYKNVPGNYDIKMFRSAVEFFK